MNELAKKMDAWLVVYGEWVVRWRWPVLLASIVLVAATGAGVQNLEFTNDYRVFFGSDNPQLMAFEELQNVYTKNDNVLFVVTPQDGEVFTNQTLAAIQDLTAGSWKLPFSIRVDSPTNFQYTKAEFDDLLVRDLVEDAESLSATELDEVRDIALREPLLLNRLVSGDGKYAGVNVTFQMPEKSLTEVPEAAAAARALAADIEARHPGVTLRLTGMVMLNNSFPESSIRDGTTLVPAMYGIIILAMFLMLRSASATFASVLIIIFSVMTAMGIAGWLGIKLTPPSASAPTIITTLAVADAIHILITMFAAMRDGLDKRAALVQSIRLNMQPVFLTSLTTSIGFLTMNFSDAPPFADLGNMTAMGVMVAWILSVTTLPALIAILPMRPRKTESSFGNTMERFADWVIAKRRPVLLVSSLIAVGLLAAVPQNELNDEFVKYFDERVAFRQHTDYATEHLTGLYNVQFSLPSGEPSGISNPEYLHDVEAFSDWLRAQPEVLHVNTITDIFKRLNKNLHADDESYYRLPEEKDLAAQYLLLFEMSLPFGLDLNNQVNIDKSNTQVIGTLRDMSSKELREIAERSETWLKNNTPNMFTHGVSPGIMFAHISERNVKSMIVGTLIGILVISVILIIALRSFRIGLLSLIPNLLPAGLAFGVWGLTRGQINMAVSVVMGMTLGIVVDDSVHFLSKYLRARREHGYDAANAVRYAFSSVGIALIVTTIILAAGFSILAQSSFDLNAAMAKLTAIAIVFALIADFLMLPPLLMWVDGLGQRVKDVGEQRRMRHLKAYELNEQAFASWPK